MSYRSVRVLTSSLWTAALVLGAAACAAPDATDPGAPGAPGASDEPATEAAQGFGRQAALVPHAVLSPEARLAAASLTGTLSCNLEYERFTPTFLTLPQGSFSQPMSVVASTGVSTSNGTLLLYAGVNPTPPFNLSFEVGVIRVSTGKTLSYVVLPPPTAGGAFLFENGAQITTVTIGGILYDHIRTYCSLTP
jgi:hypothetical protein